MNDFTPTPEQELALTQPAPLLVLAGAGTGKTTVLTRRIARAIVSGAARPDQVLALTFTDKAAAEMAERLGIVLGESGLAEAALEATVGTFHHFGGLVIRENLLRLGFDRPPAVLSGPAAWQLMAAIFDDLTFEAVEISTGQPGAVFARLLHLFSQCRDHLVSPDDLEQYATQAMSSNLPPPVAEYLEQRRAQVRDVAAAYRAYEGAKRERCAIDFGDHLYLPVRLFQEHRAVRDTYRRRFRFLFVDEYQDTNHAQRELLLALLDPAQPEIMVIGDDDQAIYRWRGAVVQNILHFADECIFANGQVKQVPMTLNRRSWPPILDLANLAISGVQHRHEKTLGYHEDNKQGHATIGHYLAASDREEGGWIAAEIEALVPEVRDLPGKKRGYGAFLILCRKRRLFEPIGQALERAAIPYELIGGTGFYDRWEIRDILSYLRVLADPDDMAVARILRSRRWRLGGRELFHLGQWVQRENGSRGRNAEGRPKAARLHLLDAVLNHDQVKGLSSEARSRLDALREELRAYAQVRQRAPLAELVTHVVERTGYRRELRAQPGFDARVALLNLDKLEEMARQFGQAGAEATLADFVEFVGYALDSSEEESEVRPIDEETDTVKVMTVHQAKGLEFPIVFIPGLAEKIFPTPGGDEADKWYELPWELRGDRDYLPRIDLASVRTERDLKRAIEARKDAEKGHRMDEERRLFYVAITRAQRQLYFTRAHWYNTTMNPRAASSFWDIITGSGLSRNLGEEECPAENPNTAWTTSGSRQAPDTALERDGDLAVMLLSDDDPGGWIEATAKSEGYGRWTVLRAEIDRQLEALGAEKASALDAEKIHLSCSGLMLYSACPRHYRYIYIDRLPTRPSPAAAIGREAHQRIEELGRPVAVSPRQPGRQETPDEDDAQVAEEQLEEILDIATQRILAAPGRHKVDDLVARFRESVYGRRAATHVETPFRLVLQGGSLAGRIDRLDELPGGNWELVDFKSGTPAVEAAEIYRRQLALYTLAVRDIWRVPAERISAHLFFLQDGSDLALSFTDADLNDLKQQAEAALLTIARGEFPTRTASPLCDDCNYNHLCAAPSGQM